MNNFSEEKEILLLEKKLSVKSQNDVLTDKLSARLESHSKKKYCLKCLLTLNHSGKRYIFQK